LSGPFDNAHYEALLEGLEITVARCSEILKDNPVIRIDSEYFSKEARRLLAQLCTCPVKRISQISNAVTDGIHASIDFSEGSGIRLISAKHPKENYFDAGTEEISRSQHEANSRTALRRGDVVISTVGTIGNAAVVDRTLLPANTDRHVGIVRLKKGWEPEFLSTFLMSKYGQFQMRREVTGNVQPSLFISKINDILVPDLPSMFRLGIKQQVERARNNRWSSLTALASAEQALLDALGLANWRPPEPLTYTRSSKDVMAAGRFDSQYFAPRVALLLERLGKDGLAIRDVASSRQERFKPENAGSFRYIEIGDILGNGTVADKEIEMAEAPSRAIWLVKAGDVLTSTVRPNRRLSALVMPEQDGCVASSGFVVLQPKYVAAEVLLTYLRLPIFCELMDLHTSASLYPAISEQDFLNLPFPKVEVKTTEKIVDLVRSSHALRQQSQVLLDRAQQAVEVAIEEGEAAGMAILEEGDHV